MQAENDIDVETWQWQEVDRYFVSLYDYAPSANDMLTWSALTIPQVDDIWSSVFQRYVQLMDHILTDEIVGGPCVDEHVHFVTLDTLLHWEGSTTGRLTYHGLQRNMRHY